MNRSQIINLLEAACEVAGWASIKPYVQSLLSPNRPPPPISIAFNILPTLQVLDSALRRVPRLVEIQVNSAYRDEIYNRAVGGSPDSQHVHFRAIDVQPRGCTAEELYDYLNESALSHRLGLGLYDHFVHVDCRHWPGNPGWGDVPTRWDNRTGA